MTAKELRQKYLDFFKSKGHEIIPSAPVVPENDPTTLFITAGMHPLVPFLMGEKHPLGKRLANSQKSIRTIDIDEVGDTTHHTFFEMLGNWSLGDYFKKEAIEWSWEFLTSHEWLNLDKDRLACSVFEGDEDVEFDQEAYDIWKNDIGMPEAKIAKLPKKNNWWGPAGETGPCGPDSEMFYWVGDEEETPKSFNDDNSKWVEIWNDVFMEFNKNAQGKYEKLSQQNVDTGMGLVRTLAVVNGLDDNYRTELFWPVIEKIEELSEKKYDSDENKRAMRIIADHIVAAVFIIADGVEPSNVQRGYVLRRLIRRAVRQGHLLGINDNFTSEIAIVVQEIYKDVYPEVMQKKILEVLSKEEDKFRKTILSGLKRFKKYLENPVGFWYEKEGIRNTYANDDTAGMLFDLYQTYGFPIEMVFEEMMKEGINIDNEGRKKIEEKFNGLLEKHQELSRTASAGMFKGGLADTKEKTTQLHTATHLMLAGLRKVLGDHVHQKGSNINGERARFDFSHNEKMTDEQKKAVEEFVNDAVSAKVPVILKEMTLEEAKEFGAEGAFEHKYGDKVKVYSIEGYSKEICGGPHVENTGDIKGTFKIKKEESSSAGVRRIKAVVE
ncbi:MAG TPA: alanine--tRNA ligase [Patescibacteria group bacterium]|nr:alanine--tRNA ligase [Patescibacteria group bacterium]